MENNLQSPKKKEKLSFNQILSFVAFIGIGCIAIALILTLIFENNVNVSNVFRTIGEVIAYLISIFLAFFWVKTHPHKAWLICYVIFVVTIVVLYILTVI